MKTCLICGASVADNAPSCPKCGEASWAVATPAAAVVVPPKAEQPQRPYQQPQHNKGRR